MNYFVMCHEVVDGVILMAMYCSRLRSMITIMSDDFFKLKV